MLVVKFRTVLLVVVCATAGLAQDTAPTVSIPEVAAPSGNPFVTLAGEFFEHDYFNIYGYGDGAYDSFAPIVQNGQSQNNGSFGWDVGGGVSGRHASASSVFSISYRGDYHHYDNTFYSSGTDQLLSLGYSKRLTRRLALNVGVSGGTFLYANNFFLPATEGQVVEANPFSNENRYASASVTLAYQQTRRLSYVVGGNFFLQRYTSPGAIGSTGGSGSASVQYRLTPKTTVGGSYSYAYFGYQGAVGSTRVNSEAATFYRLLPDHFSLSLYGGVSETSASGIVTLPINLLINGQPISGFITGPYHQSATIPSFGGTVSKAYRHMLLSLSAGQGISAGNGYFLSSRSDFVTGVFSYGMRQSSISAGGTYSRLSSLANSISNTYTSSNFSVSYSRVVVRYVSANLRYDFVRYANVGSLSGVTDNRISFGISFSSKSVPLTLF